MNRILLLIFTLTLLFANVSFGQQLIGNWQGSINVQGTQLNVSTTFNQTGGNITGTIDIPQQRAADILLEEIVVTDADSVFFQFKAGPGLAKFEGLLLDNKIEGNFFQQGMEFPFELHKKVLDTED